MQFVYPACCGEVTPLYAKHDLVVGIYSGRQYPDLERPRLGIVWKRRVIEEIVLRADVTSRAAV